MVTSVVKKCPKWLMAETLKPNPIKNNGIANHCLGRYSRGIDSQANCLKPSATAMLVSIVSHNQRCDWRSLSRICCDCGLALWARRTSALIQTTHIISQIIRTEVMPLHEVNC